MDINGEMDEQTHNMVLQRGGSSSDPMNPSLLTSKRAVHPGANCRILLLCNNQRVFLGLEPGKGGCVCVYGCLSVSSLICVCVGG